MAKDPKSRNAAFYSVLNQERNVIKRIQQVMNVSVQSIRWNIDKVNSRCIEFVTNILCFLWMIRKTISKPTKRRGMKLTNIQVCYKLEFTPTSLAALIGSSVGGASTLYN